MRTTAAHKGHARTEGETRPHDVSRWRGQKWRTGGSDKGRFGDHHPVAGPVIALMPQESGRVRRSSATCGGRYRGFRQDGSHANV